MATITVHAGGSIQAAINSAANGDTIFIENGTYHDQIEIAGRSNLIIQGESEAGVIITPNGTSGTALEQNATDATTSRLQHAIIAVSNSTNITIENLKVDGADRGNDVVPGNDFVGIAAANSTGTIHGVDVSGIRDALVGGELSGTQRGNAIVITNAVGSPHSFTVSDSSVENYQKTAILARNTIVTLSNNDIDGGGPHTGIAQNGIQLSSGSTGSVTGNHIAGIGYTGSDSVVGLFVFDSHGTVTVSGNTFDGTTANDIFAYVSSSTGVTVSGNTINNSDQGVVDTDTITTPNDITNNTYNHVDTPYSFDPNPSSQTTPYNIQGTPGDDYLHGGAGNDHIDGAGGSDTVDMSAAGAGGAFVNLTSGIAVSAATGTDTLVSIENIIGSAGNDQLIGNASANTFFASAGSDTIDGRGGSDTFDASSATGSVVIDLDSGFVGGAFTANLTSIENAVGGSGADFIAGGTGPNTLTGNGGNNSFLNLHDGDVVHGGSGLDTAVFAGNFAAATIAAGPNGTITVTQSGETVTLDKVETLQFADHNVLVVGAGGDYATIQSAINASHTGDTILVAAGTYNENVTVNVDGLTIKAIGDATVHGTFKSSNGGIADGGVAAFLESGASYVQTAGRGITISADNVTLDGLHIDGFNYGVELSDGTDGATLKNIAVTDSLVGIRKGTTAGITNLTINGGSVSDGLIGLDFDKTTTVGAGAVGTADHVTIDGTSFSHLAYKGIYVEALSNAHITNVTMNDVGPVRRAEHVGHGGLRRRRYRPQPQERQLLEHRDRQFPPHQCGRIRPQRRRSHRPQEWRRHRRGGPRSGLALRHGAGVLQRSREHP